MKTAISSLEPLVAERKRMRLKVPATAIEVPKLPLTRKITKGHQTWKQGQTNDKFSGVEGSVFISPG